MEEIKDYTFDEIEGLAHVALLTPDIEKSIRFYTEKLGFTYKYSKEIPSEVGTTKLTLIGKESCVIELVQPANPKEAEKKEAGLFGHLALQVKNIDSLVSKLRSLGIDTFESEEVKFSPGHYNGAKIIFFKGPSGERIELFEYV